MTYFAIAKGSSDISVYQHETSRPKTVGVDEEAIKAATLPNPSLGPAECGPRHKQLTTTKY